LIKDETKEPVKPEMDVEHCDVDVKVPITDSKCKSEVKKETETKEEKKPLLLGSETCELAVSLLKICFLRPFTSVLQVQPQGSLSAKR